jgi:hypothetical protein
MRPCDLRRSAIKLLSQRIFSASRRIFDLKNAANGSGKDDKRDRCRQRRAILAHQFTRIRFSVHMAMESGRRRRCEQDACTFELCAALSLAKLYQSNNRGATPPRWRLALSIIKTSCSSLDEAMLVASKFQCPSCKDPFEARMRISSQHTASAAAGVITRCYSVNRATSNSARRVDLRANSAPRRTSFIGRD